MNSAMPYELPDITINIFVKTTEELKNHEYDEYMFTCCRSSMKVQYVSSASSDYPFLLI